MLAVVMFVSFSMKGTTLISRIQHTATIAGTSRELLIIDHSDRLRLAFHALESFKKNWLYGSGFGNFRVSYVNAYSGELGIYRYPHNIALEIAAATGILGLSLWCGALFLFQVFVAQRLSVYPGLLFLSGYMNFVLLTALFFGDIYDFRMYWLVGLIIIVAAHRVEKPNLLTRCP